LGLFAPAVPLVAVVMADLVGGHTFIVLGLVVIAPLFAASLAGPRLTGLYAVVALLTAAVLGYWDRLYTEDIAGGLAAQLVRLGGVVFGGVLAVWASARRVERERRLMSVLKVAEVAQRTILPALPPRLPGLEIASAYQSAAADSLVGGDLYEVLASPWGPRLLIGDARGKGLDAVRLAARVLGCFRTLAQRTPDLAELIAALDAEVRDARLSEEDFVTALVAQIGSDGRVMVVNAGHPDPLLIAGHTVTPLEPMRRSLPLGLGTSATPNRYHIPASGRLLLYTDGLIEARQRKTREFLPYTDVVRDAFSGGTLNEALAALLAAVNSWAGGLGDDLALLAVAPTPSR
jgi:hypothetical protein